MSNDGYPKYPLSYARAQKRYDKRIDDQYRENIRQRETVLHNGENLEEHDDQSLAKLQDLIDKQKSFTYSDYESYSDEDSQLEERQLERKRDEGYHHRSRLPSLGQETGGTMRSASERHSHYGQRDVSAQ